MNQKNSNNELAIENSNIIGDLHIGDKYYKNNSVKFTFNSKHFKNILDLLNEEFKKYEENKNVINRIKIVRDVENKEKNKKHGLEQIDYEKKIRDNITPYKDEFDNFFQNPRNSDSILKYKEIIRNLNITLKAYENNINNILWFFCEINAKMRERYSTELENFNIDLVEKFLCYAYFVCDLDKDK